MISRAQKTERKLALLGKQPGRPPSRLCQNSHNSQNRHMKQVPGMAGAMQPAVPLQPAMAINGHGMGGARCQHIGDMLLPGQVVMGSLLVHGSILQHGRALHMVQHGSSLLQHGRPHLDYGCRCKPLLLLAGLQPLHKRCHL